MLNSLYSDRRIINSITINNKNMRTKILAIMYVAICFFSCDLPKNSGGNEGENSTEEPAKPRTPTVNKLKEDLIGRTFIDKPGGYFEDRSFCIAENEIKDIEILEEREEGNLYTVNATILLQAREGAIKYSVNLDIIYLRGEDAEWVIDGISANSISVVKTGLYDKYITPYISSFPELVLSNYSDAVLRVGGQFYSRGRWIKFCVDVPGNNCKCVGGMGWNEYVTDFEIHFIERV